MISIVDATTLGMYVCMYVLHACKYRPRSANYLKYGIIAIADPTILFVCVHMYVCMHVCMHGTGLLAQAS